MAAPRADGIAEPGQLPEHVRNPSGESPAIDDSPPATGRTAALRVQVRRFERALIAEAAASHGTIRGAARRLGIDVAMLIRKERSD